MPSPIKLLVGALASLLMVVGLAGPAPAATPSRVPVPYITAASPHSITVTWPAVAKARRYTVYVASSPSRAVRTKLHAQKSRGRHTTLKIRDLRHNRRYCFTVRAVRGGAKGKRSDAVCGHTLRRLVDTKKPKVSVATFNVCAYAVNCRKWTKKREDAIVRRIRSAKADVVAVQEVTGRADKLAKRLRPYGYAYYSLRKTKRDEAVYYRTKTLSMAVTTTSVMSCEVEPYAGGEDTSGWRFPRHLDTSTGRWFAYGPSGWRSERPVCRERQFPAEQEGRIGSPTGATAAWAALRLRRNGRTYVFVSAHLSHGPTSSAARLRGRETKQLIRSAKAIAGSAPVIFMGDFNSYRGGPGDDPPRRQMAERGWVDSFDSSATYTRPYVSSFNGWSRKVQTLKYWGGHIDRIFIPTSMGSTSWRVVAKTQKRRYVGTQASDHNLVRTTIILP